MKERAKIFICHASEDKEKAIEIYKHLRKSGLNPWMDKINLLPGQNWQIEIPKALKSSDFVVICFSLTSIGKRGYVQREFKLALDILNEIPEEKIFVIPLRLEDCIIPDRFAHLQYCDMFGERGLKKLSESILLHHSGKMIDEQLLNSNRLNNKSAYDNTGTVYPERAHYFKVIQQYAKKNKRTLLFFLGILLYCTSFFLPAAQGFSGFDIFEIVAIESPIYSIMDFVLYVAYNLSYFSMFLIVVFFFLKLPKRILYILPFSGTISALFWVIRAVIISSIGVVFEFQVGYWIWVTSISLCSCLFFLSCVIQLNNGS